jgi:hypothetical protein
VDVVVTPTTDRRGTRWSCEISVRGTTILSIEGFDSDQEARDRAGLLVRELVRQTD